MSHISSSRMPHAYATPGGVSETAKRNVASARNTSGTIWMLGAIGIGAVGAALYATLRSSALAPKRRRASRRKPAARRTNAAA